MRRRAFCLLSLVADLLPMTLCSRRAIALLLFLAALVHPAVHGDSFGSWNGPVIRDTGASTDCPCVRAAVISAAAPADPGRPLDWTSLDATVEQTDFCVDVRSSSSRAPPAVQV